MTVLPTSSVETEILREPEAYRNVYFFLFEIQGTFLEIKYATPLAVNWIMCCDLGFCPKLERNIRSEG